MEEEREIQSRHLIIGAEAAKPKSSHLQFFPRSVLIRELDLKKRQDLWKQIQVRWAAEITDFIGPIPGLSQTLRIAWPYFQNFDSLVFWNTLVDTQNYYWYDKTKV